MAVGRTNALLITAGLVSIAAFMIITTVGSDIETRDDAFSLGALNHSAANLQVSLEDSQLRTINSTINSSSDRARVSPVYVTEKHVAMKETDMLKRMWMLGDRSSFNVTDSDGNNILKEWGPPARDYGLITILECDNGRTEDIVTGAHVDIYLTRNIAEGESLFIQYDLARVATMIADKYNFTLASFYPVEEIVASDFATATVDSQQCAIEASSHFDDRVIHAYASEITFSFDGRNRS